MSITTIDIRQALMREVQLLPDDQLPGVLEYIRFLRIKLFADQELADRFDAALSTARAIAQQEDISQEDIEREIKVVRSGQ